MQMRLSRRVLLCATTQVAPLGGSRSIPDRLGLEGGELLGAKQSLPVKLCQSCQCLSDRNHMRGASYVCSGVCSGVRCSLLKLQAR